MHSVLITVNGKAPFYGFKEPDNGSALLKLAYLPRIGECIIMNGYVYEVTHIYHSITESPPEVVVKYISEGRI
jgi:hypothetical protein